MISRITRSPLLVRVVPFVAFLALTACQGEFGEGSRYGFYLVKVVVGAAMLWAMRPHVAEMRWAMSWEAVVVGVAVCVMWIGIDSTYPSVDEVLGRVGISGRALGVHPAADWNPFQFFAGNVALAWSFVVVRLLGSSLVVPPLEEVFYRSFLYRWLTTEAFDSEPLGRFVWKPFVITVLLFGFEHHQWLAGILCGIAYQGLVIRKKRLGDVITAHAITNGLLGLWVVGRGAWQFW
jgi:uncharacterized protein